MRWHMDNDEIVIAYRTAKDKAEQIHILAELTQSDDETIIAVLRESGEPAGAERTCKRCGRQYFSVNKRGRAMCPSCREEAFREKKREYTRLRTQIARNMAKIHDLNRENETLKRELKELTSKTF